MKPREFWIDLITKEVHLGPLSEQSIRVREVVPIDWERVWEGIAFNKYTQHVDQPTKEMIKQLVEAQLKEE